MKKSVTIRRNLEPPCACGTLESGPPPTDEGRAISRAWLFNNTHLQSGSPHTAAYTWASHLPAQLWHPFWPHCLETKRSMEFWVMAKWVTMVTLYPSAPPTYLHLFTTHTEDATHINVFQPTHSPPSHTHTHTRLQPTHNQLVAQGTSYACHRWSSNVLQSLECLSHNTVKAFLHKSEGIFFQISFFLPLRNNHYCEHNDTLWEVISVLDVLIR